MSDSKFLKLLQESKPPLLGDGAMGTMLSNRGIGFKQCFDELNLNQPDLVAGIHQAYIDSGAQVIQTNTFGANRYKLASHGLESNLKRINQAGAELALGVKNVSAHEVFVAGDIGPLGVRLAPFGRVQREQARNVFAEQVDELARSGVDLIIFETFSDLFEIQEAITAARQVCDLPIVASMTFTRDDRTILGDSPTNVAQTLHTSGANVMGVNCSGGPAQIWRILSQMRQIVPDAIFSVMPNAGWPEQIGGRIMYPANPDYFSEYALAFCDAGARLIGGCCGTTPDHIAAMRTALDENPAVCGPPVDELILPIGKAIELDTSKGSSRLAQHLTKKKFVISVEMDPPRGLSAHKIIAGASLLNEAGADVINVADSPMARMRMSPWAVCNLIQDQVGIETTLHFPTRGRNLLRVQGDLLAAHALGIHNVFVVMGDPTSIGDYPDAMDDYDLVPSGLIKLIKQNFNTGMDHAGTDIGQPTIFFVGCALNLSAADPQREISILRRKLSGGADFILTQPVFQPEIAESFLNRYQDQYGPLEIPLLVGVLPLYGTRHALFLHNEVPGINIPEDLHNRLQGSGNQAPREGVEIALELIDQQKTWADGIYLMPAFGRYDLAAEIVEGCRY